MWWFKILFPPGMILLPVIMAAACRTPKDVQIDTRRVRRLTWTLWGCTTLALACFYAQHRRFRAWAFYGLFGLAMPLVFSLAGILVTWSRDPRMDMNLGLWGGIAGSVLGIAGAAIGTVASFRRAKIAAQLRRMLADESLPPLQRGD